MQDIGFPLVTSIDGEARASTEVIARGVGLQHKNVMELVRRYEAQLGRFGKVAFQTRLNRRGTPTAFALLNEAQASAVLTLMRNTEKVVEFKFSLIREFFRMRDELQRREQGLWAQMQALIAKEVESKVRASFGSHLMLQRKREIPKFDAQFAELEDRIQQPLFLN